MITIRLKNVIFDGKEYQMEDIQDIPKVIFVTDQVIHGIFLNSDNLPSCYEYTLTEESTNTYSFSKKIVNPVKIPTPEQNAIINKIIINMAHIMCLDTLSKTFQLSGHNEVANSVLVIADALTTKNKEEINKMFRLHPSLVVILFYDFFTKLVDNIEKLSLLIESKKEDVSDKYIIENIIKDALQKDKE